MRILVTNDDGIHAPGIHALANAMARLEGGHEIVVAAPDVEYSGSGAALGALHLVEPVLRRVELPNVDVAETWSVSGAPALCVMLARLGAFGGNFDLVVSGINPGANVGRAVYHSGTVGAALTARNGRISGIAFSQAVSGFGIEGQAWDEAVKQISWDAAAAVATAFVQPIADDPPSEPIVVNVNVPALPISDIVGWRHTAVGTVPPRTVQEVSIIAIEGDADAFRVEMDWSGEVNVLSDDTDGGAIEAGYVSVSNLTMLSHDARRDVAHAEAALSDLIRHAPA